MNPSHGTREQKLLRALRAIVFPPFHVAALLSLTTLLALLAWMFVDALGIAILSLISGEINRMTDFRLRPDASRANWDRMAQALNFGTKEFIPRAVILCVISWLTIQANSVMALRLFFGRGWGRTLKGYMVTPAVLAAWLALFACSDPLAQRATIYQLRRDLPSFESAVSYLSSHWEEGGEIPGAAMFSVPRRDRPNLKWIEDHVSRSSLKHSLGYAVSRLSEGGFRFDGLYLYPRFDPMPSGASLEFRPTSGNPYADESYMQSIELKDHWYLVWWAGPITCGSRSYPPRD